MRLATLTAAAVLALCGTAWAGRLVTITLPDAQKDVPASRLTYAGPPRADVLLPTHYNPRKRYPLIVLLPGFSNTYKILDKGMLEANKVVPDLQAIMVSPEGNSDWYTDWYNNGAYGTPKWESYILDEALPQIRQRYRIRRGRRWHALFGISMGGYGATYLGGRLPGYFGSVASLSGYVDPQAAGPVGPSAQDALAGTSPGNVAGPGTGFYATGHNPTALVRNMQFTRLFVTTGDGTPTAGEGYGGGVGNAEELGVIRPMSDAYVDALRAAHIPVTFQVHKGCHCWPDFQDELRKAMAWNPFKPVVEHPANWVNDTVATHGRLWDVGYAFAAHPDAIVRFKRTGHRLQISSAGTPVTLSWHGCRRRVATPADVTLTRC